MKFLSVALGAMLLSACSIKDEGNATAAAPAAAAPAMIPLVITANGKQHRFAMEVAVTQEEQAKGLMFRKDIPADGGMVFPMSPPRTASFWMKDTWVPLDMLFVRTDGTIVFLAANRQPYVREPVSAGVPVAGVVELRGGRAAELGIAEGDTVQWGDCAKPGPATFCPKP